MERLIAVSTRLNVKDNHDDCIGDDVCSTPTEQSSCDTSLYASGESRGGSDATEKASPLFTEIIADEDLENIKLLPIKREVRMLSDSEVGALLLRSN